MFCVHTSQRTYRNWIRIAVTSLLISVTCRSKRRPSCSSQNWEMALQLAGALFEFWALHSHLLEGLEMIDLVLKAAPDNGELLLLRAKAMNRAAVLTLFAGEHAAAYRYAEQAIDIAKRVEEDWNVALASM